LKEVEKGAELKHADTVDKSGPKIEGIVVPSLKYESF
jgi:hypothetical protein